MLRFSTFARNRQIFNKISKPSALYKPSELDSGFYDLLDQMQGALEFNPDSAIPGITASQLGIYKRVLMIRLAPDTDTQLLWMVNPLITNTSSMQEVSLEKSLSTPNTECYVSRASEIQVTGVIDNSFEYRSFRFWGQKACFMQHLVDQLDGVNFENKAQYINEVDYVLQVSKPKIG